MIKVMPTDELTIRFPPNPADFNFQLYRNPKTQVIRLKTSTMGWIARAIAQAMTAVIPPNALASG